MDPWMALLACCHYTSYGIVESTSRLKLYPTSLESPHAAGHPVNASSIWLADDSEPVRRSRLPVDHSCVKITLIL